MIGQRALVLFGCLIGLSTATIAQSTYVSLAGGYSSFGDHFSSGLTLKGRGGILSQSGIGMDITAGYIQAKKQTASDPDLKMVPVSVGINYVSKEMDKIWPYMGAELGVALMSNSFESPGPFYGGKMGVLFKLDHDLALFAEVGHTSLNDKKTGININPIQGTLGMSLMLGESKKSLAKTPKKIKKKRKKRVKKPKAPQVPKRYQ